jgi:hypothetical protein
MGKSAYRLAWSNLRGGYAAHIRRVLKNYNR